MKRIVLVLALVITLVGLSAPTPVSATPNTKVDMFQDCSSGCPEPVDMAGPTGFGFVNFNQDNSGVLRVVVSLKNAQPNTTYQIWLVCGPTHAAACGFTTIGTLTTNGVGNGNAGAIIVPLSTLQASPYGAGSRTDHIDLGAGVGNLSAGFYAVGGINYTVPAAVAGASVGGRKSHGANSHGNSPAAPHETGQARAAEQSHGANPHGKNDTAPHGNN